MARGKVVGGGDYLDWAEIAEHTPLIMVRKRAQLADRDLGSGPTAIVQCDVAVLSGPQEGRTVFGDEAAGRGITNELLRHPDGTDLPCKIELKQRFGRNYAAITAASADEVARIDAKFPPGTEDEVWAQLREAEQQRQQARSSGGGAPAPASAPAGGGDDDAPPW